MKILMLTPYLPWPLVSGGQIRTFNLLSQLKDRHEITLFSLIKNKSDTKLISHLKPYCRDIQVFRRSHKPFTLHNILKTSVSRYPFVVTRNLVPKAKEAIAQILTQESFDLIHAETFYMMPHIPPTQIPIILVEQTIEYLGYLSYARDSKLLPFKPFFYIDIAKIKYWEKYYWRHASRLIAMSKEDRDYILREQPGLDRVDIVANGVDIKHFSAVKKSLPSDPTILFVGTFSWLPNVQAVKYLVNDIWPLIKAKLPSAKLHIVGFSPTKEIKSYASLPGVRVSGSIEDIRDAYRSAHLLLAPVTWGKGTRYKILEAMASHTPIVATRIAVEGLLGVKPGKHVLIGNHAASLAAQAVKLLQDKKLQSSLAKASYDLVKVEYSWPTIAKQLDKVYQEIGLNL